MKKITLVSAVAAAAFAATAAFSATSVFADDTKGADTTSTKVSDGNATATTHGNITLTKADGTDPDNPYTDITLVKGATIDFGSAPVSTGAHTYNATNEDNVTVVNPGVASGWSVTAKASDFTGASGTLRGAELTLGLGAATTSEGDNQSEAPTTTNEGNTKGVKITGAGATVLNAADSLHGVGTWSAAVDKAVTSLSVPAGNVAGTYTAEITWTLANTVQ